MRLLVLFVSSMLSLFAHDAWITLENGRATFNYGHRTPGVGEAKTLDLDPTKLTKSCRTASGESTGWDVGCDQLIARYESGIWSKTLDGTQKGDRSAYPDALYSWESVEIVRLIRHSLSPVTKGFSLDLAEPLEDAKVGERLTFQTLLDGRALSGVPVSYFGSTRGITDADGKINIRLRHQGLQQITASYTVKSARPDIDKRIISYSLNFEVDQ